MMGIFCLEPTEYVVRICIQSKRVSIRSEIMHLVSQATNNVPPIIQECITTKTGGNGSVVWIQHDGSNTSRYQICAEYEGHIKLFHASQPAGLLDAAAAEMFEAAAFVTTGYEGNWVLGFPDRIYRSWGGGFVPNRTIKAKYSLILPAPCYVLNNI